MKCAREASGRARDYERSLKMGNATSDSVAGRCISAQRGDGDHARVFMPRESADGS